MSHTSTAKTGHRTTAYDTASPTTGECILRADDRGIVNALKAWFLYFLHLAACALLFGVLIYIDGRAFNTGSPDSFFKLNSSLYQTQVTGLISLAMVLIRILYSSCAALLVWRTIYVLIEKRHITLAELTRVNNYKMPVFVNSRGGAHISWSIWAAVVILCLWPPNFAAPLLSSAVAWIPASRLAQRGPVSLIELGSDVDYSDLLYADWQLTSVVRAGYMTGDDPGYAFTETDLLSLRRYFAPQQNIPENSRINITVPYVHVSLRWINAGDDDRVQDITNTNYTDVMESGFAIRDNGAVGIIRDEKWDAVAAEPEVPQKYNGTRLVFLKVATLDHDNPLEDGTFANSTTLCPTTSPLFGKLPPVQQYENIMEWSTGGFAGKDCYLIAEASLIAGTYSGTDCIVSTVNSAEHSATCYVKPDSFAVQEDWLTNLSLDFMPEVMKYTTLLNFTSPFTHRGVDAFTSGMMMLGYHATWSSLRKRWDFGVEDLTATMAESVVRAQVDRGKLYIWLVMNASLAVSALAVFLALRLCRVKTLRDTTLAAVTLDLRDVVHGERGSGLCNAVALRRSDKELLRLKWKQHGGEHIEGIGHTFERDCCWGRVDFEDGAQQGLVRVV